MFTNLYQSSDLPKAVTNLLLACLQVSIAALALVRATHEAISRYIGHKKCQSNSHLLHMRGPLESPIVDGVSSTLDGHCAPKVENATRHSRDFEYSFDYKEKLV